MKKIKINIELPKASEIQRDLNNLIKQIDKDTSIKLDLNIDNFNKSLGEITQSIAKLKYQVSSISGLDKIFEASAINSSTQAIEKRNEAIKEQQRIMESELSKVSNVRLINADGTETIIRDLRVIKDEYGNIIETVNRYNSKTGELTSTVVKTTNEIEKQRAEAERSMQSIEKTKIALQNKLNTSLNNKNFTLIDDKVFENLQNRIDSINTDTSIREINELKVALNNLGNSDSQIVRLQNAITKQEISISSLKEMYKDLIPKDELKKAEDSLNSLKNILDEIQSGKSYNNLEIRYNLDQASASMKDVTSSTKNAVEQQKLLNEETVTFGSALKELATGAGVFNIVSAGIDKIKDAFREGVESVIEMDGQISNLQKVIDGLSDKQLIQMRDSAVAIGESLGRTSTEIMASFAEFGKQYKDLDIVQELGRLSVMATNTMENITADKVAESLTTILASMDLGVSDAKRILDGLNEIQNNYRINSSDLLQGLAEVGSLAKTTGVELDRLNGYITGIVTTTGASGSEVGNALQTIFSRIYGVGKKTLEDIGVAVEDVNGEFRSATDILDDYYKKWQTMSDTDKITSAQSIAGVQRFNTLVSLMDNYQTAIDATTTSMNSLNSVENENAIYLESIEGRTNSLKASAEGLWNNLISSDMIKGGISTLQLLIKMLDGLQNTFGTLGLSMGVLSTTFLTFTNNPMKNFLTEIVKTEGVVKGLSTVFNKVKQEISSTGTTMGVAQKSVLALKTGYEALGIKAMVAQVKVALLQATLSMGLSLAISGVISLVGKMITSIDSGGKSMEDCKQQAESLANALNDVSKERELTKQYAELRTQLEDINLEESRKNELKKELEGVMQNLLNSEKDYYGILGNENLTLDEQLEKMEQVRKLKLFDEAKALDKEMPSQKDIEVKAKMLKEYIQTYQDIEQALNSGNKQKLIDLIGVSSTSEAIQMLKDTKNKINELDGEIIKYNSNMKLMNDSNYETSRSMVNLDSDINKFISTLNDSTQAINDNTKAKEENSNIKDDSEERARKLEELANAYTTLGYSAKDVKEKMEELQGLSSGELDKQLVAVSTEAYNESKNKVQELKNALEDLNKEQAVSSKLISEIAGKYPDILKLGSSIYDLTSVQEFLNQQIENQAQIQASVYENMISYDTDYYNNKIKNNEEFMRVMEDSINSFVGMQNSGYEIDFNNYSNLNELKNAILNQFGDLTGNSINEILQMYASAYTFDSNNFADLQSMKQGYINQLLPAIANWIASFTGGNAEGYTSDLAEFNDLTKMKAYAISQLSAKMAELQEQWNETIARYEATFNAWNNRFNTIKKNDWGGTSDAELEMLRAESRAMGASKSTGQKINQISAGIDTINKVFDGLQTTLDKYEADFTGANFNAGSVGSGNKGNKGSGGNKGNKGDKGSSKKEIADIELTIDRYYKLNDLLDDYNALLAQNRELQKYANSVDKQKLLSEEIDLMRKKKSLLSDLLAEQNKEKQEIQSYLKQYGFQIDSMENIINLQEKLTSLQSWANSQDASNKEQAIALVKKLEQATKSYTNLCNNEIPKTIQEWQQMNNAIKSSAENMLTDIRDRLVQALRKKREEEKSAKEEVLDERIKKLQEEIKALDDEDIDKRKKLIKLKNELELWKQDDSPYAKKKVQELEETIAKLEKEIRKDELQQQIDLAEKTKEELQKSYEEQLSDKELYAEADKLLTQKNMDEIVNLIRSYDETFKGLGNLLGENLAETIKLEVENAIKALDILKKEIASLSKPTVNNVSSNISGSSSSPSKPTTNSQPTVNPVKPVTNGSRVRVQNLSAPIYYTATSSGNSGTWSGTGIVDGNTPLYVVNEANGRVALSKNTSVYSAIGWIDKKYVAGFRIGGSVGSWSGGDGKIIQVHSGEGVLTAEQNKAWLNLVDILPNLSNVFNSAMRNFTASNSRNGDNASGNVTVNNNFEVTNNTAFDEERFGNNIETLFKNQLRRFGKIK